MNARSSSLQRPTLQSPIAAPMDAAAHAAAITSVAYDSHAAANENGLTAVPDDAVNPLWMITVAFAILFGAMLLLSTS